MKENKKIAYHPPRWAEWLLEWYAPVDEIEEVQGDLQELYSNWVETLGEREANRRYVFSAIRLLRPFGAKQKANPNFSTNKTAMLQHYFTIATRNLLRQKAFSFINITGLALGMACSLLIFLWVQDERSIDNFHTNGDRLFSVYERKFVNGQVEAGHGTPAIFAAQLKKTIPEVQYATGFGFPWGHPETFQAGDKIHKMEGSRADADFFKMFSFPLLEGTPEGALDGPNSLAISRKMAELFFGSPTQAIGRTIRFENRKDLKVTAVFENLPVKSSHQFDYLYNWQAYLAEDELYQKAWDINFFRTYIQLRPGADAKVVEEKIKHFLSNYLKFNTGYRVESGLQRFGDMYLYSSFEAGKPEGGRIEYVKLFSGVALFILLIACINFMNLSTARSIKRAKEVGIRKVVGSGRAYLVGQFLGEAILLAFFALAVSVVLVQVVLPSFNSLTGKQITLPLFQPAYFAVFIALAIITGLIAGSYPAFFLSSLQPVKVLKDGLRFGTRTILFRKSLVVFQFVLSILLLITTLVVTTQTEYVQNKHLGYNRENLLYIHLEGELAKKNKYLLFKKEALRMPGIQYIDRSSEVPHAMGFVTNAINWEGKDPAAIIGFKPTSVGYDFVKLMDLEVVQGRDFSEEMGTDSTAFMVNEEALRRMGMKDPLGKWVSAWNKKGTIVGVLKDYHNSSLHQPIEPLIVDVKEGLEWGVVLVRTEPSKTKQALESLEKVCKQLNPGYPFVYSFIDEEYARLYKSEVLITRLSNVFALLSGVISCLGLLGLAMFSAEQRKKEIGIRKVLGASTHAIVALFSKDFLKLVGLSFLIAAPLGWMIMSRWLENFAYAVDLSPWMFALAGGAALLVALLTVSAQAVKAAIANPVKTLRTE